MLAVMATFYINYPEHLIGVSRLPMINYIGTLLMFIIVWLLIRGGRLVQALRSDPDKAVA